jgi:hypothetical protein
LGPPWKWLGGFSLTFLVSVVGGWFLPDGLNELAVALGEEPLPTTPLVRFFSIALLFVLLAALELILWAREQTLLTNEQIDSALRSGLSSYGADLAENAVLQSLLPYRATSVDQAAYGARAVKLLGDVLVDVPPELLPGYSVVLEDRMSGVGDEVRALGSGRVSVNIAQHLQMNRRLAHSEKSYTHINRRVFNAPADWTEDWRNMVQEFGAAAFKPEYIVVLPQSELELATDKIRSMLRYLNDSAWEFRCCALEEVHDTVGKENDIDANVDVFSGRAAKLHWTPDAGYRHAATIDIRLVKLSTDQSVGNYVDTVRRFAWIPELTTGLRRQAGRR